MVMHMIWNAWVPEKAKEILGRTMQYVREALLLQGGVMAVGGIFFSLAWLLLSENEKLLAVWYQRGLLTGMTLVYTDRNSHN